MKARPLDFYYPIFSPYFECHLAGGQHYTWAVLQTSCMWVGKKILLERSHCQGWRVTCADFYNNDGGISVLYCSCHYALEDTSHLTFFFYLFFPFFSFVVVVIEVCKINKGQQHLCWKYNIKYLYFTTDLFRTVSDLCRKSTSKNYYSVLNMQFSFMQAFSSPWPLFEHKEIVISYTHW